LSIPKVSVLMSVYNGERYLREALESILNQTFSDFEFINIDDGSTDTTWRILNDYDGARIRLVRNEENIGLAGSLNKGLELARGEFIARMDADDISLPERFARQVEFLDAHPEIGVVGTAYQMIDAQGRLKDIPQPTTAPMILKWRGCFGSPLAHPAIMARKELLERVGGYNEHFRTSQDYDLLQRLSGKTRLANLPDVLLYLRKHEKSISYQQNVGQLSSSYTISQRAIADLLGTEIPKEVLAIRRKREDRTGSEVEVILRYYYKLCLALLAESGWSGEEKVELRKFVAGQMFSILRPYLFRPISWKLLGLIMRLDPVIIFKRGFGLTQRLVFGMFNLIK